MVAPQKKGGRRGDRPFVKVKLRLPTATAAASTAVATTTAATATTASAAVAAAATNVAAATTAASAAATTVTAATTWWPCFTGARFIHGQRATFDSLSVELGDCLLRIRIRGHRDKGEAARFTGKLILHQRDLLHRARLSEKILQISFGRVEGKISYV